MIKITFQSAKEYLCKDTKSSFFELFGFDFIVDSSFKTWLIEVNTNPCLEESSKILKSYIPRMIDDALKLTVDTVFKKKAPASSEAEKPTLEKVEASKDSEWAFPVDGYSDSENMWECILNLV